MRMTPFLGFYEPVSSLTHLLAAFATLIGAYFLIRKGRGNVLRTGSLLIFLGALFFLFTMSGVYHSLPPGPWRHFFKRLDYAAIWLVIAGSATPIHILMLRGFWRWGVLTIFWGVSIVSLILVDTFIQDLPYWAVVTAYISVGSLGTVMVTRLIKRIGLARTQGLIVGALFYIGGAIIDFLEKPVLIEGVFGGHEIFHLCVMVGAGLHYIFIFAWADVQLIRGRTYLRKMRRRLAAAWHKS